ncbi:hypothetical protein C7431_103343 [Pantoea allii]|uniref:Uncharacterized protein n=1 Tax=Pantoea allii TaxID=574096 RepID=A0A2V2BDH6_9GAMM|nr:hypothetical protein [Pantoea allii]PWK98574.1 hypothetical protein C7431_103343 [Pantoea allii]
MGLFRPDNELRNSRFIQLQLAISNSDIEINNSSKRLVQSIDAIDKAILNLSEGNNYKSSFNSIKLSENLIPSFTTPDTPIGNSRIIPAIKIFASARAALYAGSKTYTALQPWVQTAINNYARQLPRIQIPAGANQFRINYLNRLGILNRIPPGARELSMWQRFGGIRGVGRMTAVTGAGLLAGIIVTLAIESILDEVQYAKLVEAIEQAAALRYVSTYCFLRMKAIEEIFKEAELTISIYTKNRTLPFDMDDYVKNITTSLEERLNNTEAELQKFLTDNDNITKAYTSSDPSQDVLDRALSNYKKNLETLASGTIESISISSGWLVDSLQVNLSSRGETTRWGGQGGNAATLEIPQGIIKSISWQRGDYQNEPCIYDLAFETLNGTMKFGNPSGHSEVTPNGERVVVNVPDGWRIKDIVCSVEAGSAVSGDKPVDIANTRFVRDIYVIGEPG